MRLTIATDLKDTKWLAYIVAEFERINLAKFDIDIISIDEQIDSNHIVYYLSSSRDDVTIFNSNEPLPSSRVEYLRDDLYVVEGSWYEDRFDISYDLFWNAFVFLSRYEEYLSQKSGKEIYSYSLNHPRADRDSFYIPIVNILFNELEILIKEHFPDLIFAEREKPTIELSHDVDYIEKTLQLRLKQTLFNGFNTLKSITKPKLFLTKLADTLKFTISNPSYWCFDYWVEIEKRYKKRSVFYIYVKSGKKDFKSWLIDPSYDIVTDSKLQKRLQELIDDGFEIGLHGSYHSASDYKQLKDEIDILERIVGIKVIKSRQHWLNYYESITPYSHHRLFEYDSTLGWNDRMGFRSGSASRYRPYDFENKRAFDFQVTPQVIMDSNIYDYGQDSDIYDRAKGLIKVAKEVSKSTYISISWHQRVCSSDYNWHKFYKELIDDI